MCVGGLFGGGRPPTPAAPIRQGAAPTVKSAQKGPEYVEPEKIKEELGEDQIDTKKKKALEIKKTKEGVKQFGAIDPKVLPDTPAGGITTPQ